MTSEHFTLFCFTKVLNAFFVSIFRYRCYNRLRICAMQIAKCLECLLLTHFLVITIFPKCMEGVQNSSGNSRGVGVILVVKKWKFRGGGGFM